jgi:hypothetical protein
MPNENVGIKTGLSIKKQTLDENGKVEKSVFFFPDLGVSIEAENMEEARVLAEEEAEKKKSSQ